MSAEIDYKYLDFDAERLYSKYDDLLEALKNKGIAVTLHSFTDFNNWQTLIVGGCKQIDEQSAAFMCRRLTNSI